MGIGIRLGGIRVDVVPPLINAPFAELIDTWHYEYDGNDFKEKIYDLDTLLATPNIDFDPDNTLAPALDMFDRSNTTIWSADARGVGYNAAEPYTWANPSEIFPDTLLVYGNEKFIVEDNEANKHYITSFPAITDANKTLSSMMVCRIFRDADSPIDTYTDFAGFLEFDIHYQTDQERGSRQPFIK